MKIVENQEQSDFHTKSLTSIPFGGPIGKGSNLRVRAMLFVSLGDSTLSGQRSIRVCIHLKTSTWHPLPWFSASILMLIDAIRHIHEAWPHPFDAVVHLSALI